MIQNYVAAVVKTGRGRVPETKPGHRPGRGTNCICSQCHHLSFYLFFYCDDEELHGKTHKVSRVKTVPKCQKEEGAEMRHCLVAQELQSLEDVPIQGENKTKKTKGT